MPSNGDSFLRRKPTHMPHSRSVQDRELADFREKTGGLLEHIPAMVFDTRGVVRMTNSAAESIIGCEHDAVIGQTLRKIGCKIVDEYGRPMARHLLPWRQKSEAAERISRVIAGIQRPDGAIAWHQTVNMSFRNGTAGRRGGCLTLFLDITPFKRSQEELVRSQKMEALGSMAAGMTHEFNNVLTSIRSAVQLLLAETGPSDPRRDAFRDIEQETLRGAELIKQLLLFSKPQSAPGRSTRINEEIDQLQRLFRRILPRTITLETDTCAGEFCVRMDPFHLRQILFNMILNARDAIDGTGAIRISTSAVAGSVLKATDIHEARCGTYARIVVSDTGRGIAPENFAHIFEPFFTTKARQGGTGLGLAIVYGLIRQHRGFVGASPLPDRGTAFTIHLPARPACARRLREAQLSSTPRGRYETVLVVDDEPLITRSTTKFIEHYGYHAISAMNGHSAMDIFKDRSSNIDLVLLDLEMPETSGWACMKEMLRIAPTMPIIVLSGYLLGSEQVDPVSMGAARFVRKPFDSHELLRTMRQVLDNRCVSADRQVLQADSTPGQ